MRALLDVNVLVALLDPEHSFHDRAHSFWKQLNKSDGWSSCPITQNGVLRILSSHRYPRSSQYTKTEVFANLTRLITDSDHRFWPDEISLLDSNRFDPRAVFGPKHLTDIYLLGLAMYNKGKFVTFDQRIPPGVFLDPIDEYLLVV